MLALAGCSRLAWWKDRPSPAQAAPVADATDIQVLREDHEAALEQMVKQRVAATPSTADRHQGRLVRRKPYFYREYVNYPEGPDSLKTLITETESRTAPYIANVKLSKVRYATRFHRKKDQARNDENYFRSTGVETLTYEYRNGKWVLLGSFFNVDETQENVNGEWVPLEAQVQRALAGEDREKKGWFGRTWSRLLRRD